jgi:NADH-quinone oxidoreductase subunit M
MKRFIAYVSIAHFGFIALGIFSFSAQSETGAVSYMLNHSISTGMLILVIGMVVARGGSSLIADYGGLARITPALAGVFLVAGLASLSLPGTNSFISEFLVLVGSYGNEPVYTIIATVGMIFAALYILWLYQRVFHGPVRGNALVGIGDTVAGGPGAAIAPEVGARKAVLDLSGREKLVLAPLLVLVIGIGFYPKPVLDVITPTVDATLSSVGIPDGGN